MKTSMLLVLLASFFISQTDWVLKKNSDNIKVYVGTSEVSAFKQFKVEAPISAKPQDIANAIIDVENNHKWLSNVEKGEIIERISETEFVYRQVVDVPFPFTDREVVQHISIDYLPNNEVRVNLKDENDAIPENEEFVRMPIAQGFWLLVPNGEVTNATYTYLADPGGSMPAWLVNSFLVDMPFQSIKNLRSYLAKNG